MPGTRSTFAERQTGREYIDVVPDREAIARYGLTVRDVHDVVEAAVGGMPVSTVIAGRSRFSINLRYAADYRADPEALRRILVPVPASEPVGEVDLGGSGAGTSPAMSSMAQRVARWRQVARVWAAWAERARRRRPMAMGTTGTTPASPAMGGGTAVTPDLADRFRQAGATVPLGALADVRVTSGPPMIKDENGVLVGYVFADIDAAQRDLGGWVSDAKRLVAQRPGAASRLSARVDRTVRVHGRDGGAA